MNELSLHILDIVGNSTVAGAKNVSISIVEQTKEDSLTIRISDDGCGMDKEFLENVVSPFTTKRTTRKVGLGIPLFKMAAELSGGSFSIESELNVGTNVEVVFGLNHIDRAPVGDMASTIQTIVMSAPDVDFSYLRQKDGEGFEFKTKDVREQIGDIPIDSLDILAWIKEFIKENEQNLGGTL